jgi:hypothetical protein
MTEDFHDFPHYLHNCGREYCSSLNVDDNKNVLGEVNVNGRTILKRTFKRQGVKM